MKLVELNLLAFGPFTERRLLFVDEGEQPGLQIVYGPNEAGKSSALRGLRALLYGIDSRSTDDFVHPHKQMRIGGCLQNAAGERLEFTRRKGNKDTLLNAAGDAPLNEMALAPFLQTVTADMFSSLFGIDHPALLRGGQEILEQKGELGRALFSAALGSHDLNAVLKGLDDEADALFKQRGSKQQINAAISAYKACKRELREQSLKPADWQRHSDALQQTRQALEQVQNELSGQRCELSRLQRIQRLQPRFVRHRQLLDELAELQDVVLLDEDFSRRRSQAITDQARAAAELDAARPRVKALREELAALSIDQAVLEQADEIGKLHERIGTEAKAQRDRRGLVAERQALLKEATRVLKAIRPDLQLAQIETLRPLLAQRRRLSDAHASQQVASAALRQAQDASHAAQHKLSELQRVQHGDADAGQAGQTPSAQALDGLRRALDAARREGDVDGQLRAATATLAELQQRCEAATGRAGLTHIAAEALPALALPNKETLARFERDFAALEQRQQRLQDEQQQHQARLRDTDHDRDAMQRAGTVPSEAELQQQREQRDQLWGQLRSGWLDAAERDPASSDPATGERATATPLADAFEQQRDSADELADRLRREADRVQKLAQLDADRHSLQQALRDNAAARDALADQQQQLTADWQAQWQNGPSVVRSPAEMRAWLDDFERLREQLLQRADQQAALQALRQTRQRHIHSTRQALTALGQPSAADSPAEEQLEPLLADSEALLERLDRQRQQQQELQRDHQRLQQTLSECDARLQQAQQQQQQWQQQWQALLADTGLSANSSPAEAADFIDTLQQVFAKQHDIDELQRRIDGIDRDAAAFATRISELSARIAPELGDAEPADAARELASRLQQSRSAQEQQQRLQKRLDQATTAVEQAKLSAATADRVLAALAEQAGCENNDSALLQAERRSTDKAQRQTELTMLEQQISADSAGASLDELRDQLSEVDADALSAEIDALNASITTELEPRQTELAETVGGQQKELDQMDGSGAAAALAEQAQQTLAGIRADAERYMQLKLAARILRDQIERYRQHNHGPLVQRASEHFNALTLGSFERLSIDFNDKDQAVLAGLRPSGGQVQVDGMSAGTRDQLYLALRLASLEKYIHSAEPMPFIVDDVLVDFDDQRSVAALQTLAGLAEHTQVILFTHHARLVEQAQQLDQAVQLHTL